MISIDLFCWFLCYDQEKVFDYDWLQIIDVEKNIFDLIDLSVDCSGCCNQDHRPRGGWRWDWRYPTGDHGSITMWFTLCYKIFRILSKGKY